MKRKHSDAEGIPTTTPTIKTSKRRITRTRTKSITTINPSQTTPTQSKQTEQPINPIQSEQITPTQSEQEEQEQITPTQSQPQQEQEQEQHQELSLISGNKNSRLQNILNHYNDGKKDIKDYRDTIAQISHTISKDLSSSLINWDHELRNQRKSNQYLDCKSFTLWPLNLPGCPKPEWTLDEELLGLLNRFYFQKYQLKFKSFNDDLDDDHLDFDFELNQTDSNTILKKINITFETLLLELIKYVPRNQVNKKQKDVLDLVLDLGLVKDFDPGLKWKDVLNVSGNLGIHQNVLDRTRDRLEQIYQGTSLHDHDLSQIVE